MSIKEEIKRKVGPSTDFIFKDLIISKEKILLVFNETLIDTTRTNDFILRNLLNKPKKELNNLENNIPNINIKKISKEEIIDLLVKGFIIIITKNNIYAAEVRNILDRGIQAITSELSIAGPKDSFTENYNININLIRKRIKTTDLIVENIELGKLSKTKIGILYMNNIAKKEIINGIKNHLNKIDIDGIIDSSYLKRTLEKKNVLFPTITLTERPDKTSMALLEGKVVIIVDMSPYALILPSFFIDFFHTTDDYYQKSLNASFIRLIRFFAFLVAVFTPAIYISITTRNYDLVPLNILLTLKAGRTFVPFPAYIEALFMLICFEILKESDLRMSKTSSSAVSILGGLILGEAAVSAGIVSPIMIIVIAISSIASLTFTSIELGNALRNYKLLLLLLSTILGINGLLIGTTILIYQLLTLKVFGIPYLNPIIPFEKNEIKDTIIKINSNKETRNSQLTDNIKRGKYL
ncbi:MAG: spore germination protein [Bacilli bacterium]|nr:spore germination protein [Bacilli bacterium]